MSFFPPKLAEFNFLQHMQSILWTEKEVLTPGELAYHVAYLDSRGNPKGWFFDSFLLKPAKIWADCTFRGDLEIGAMPFGEPCYLSVPAPEPTNSEDWKEALDRLLAENGPVLMMDKSVTEASHVLGKPPHKRNIILALPYADPRQSRFQLPTKKGSKLNFRVADQNLSLASEQRVAAYDWYVGESVRRWKKLRPRNLDLLGFCWSNETICYSWDVDDHWVMKETYQKVRDRDTRLFWTPFYSSFNVALLQDGQEMYFDCAFLQPNHSRYTWVEGVGRAARDAYGRGAGIGLEYYCDRPDQQTSRLESQRRFRNYLDGGVEFNYMQDSACSHLIGINDLSRLARSRDSAERGLYRDLFLFTQGTYEAE